MGENKTNNNEIANTKEYTIPQLIDLNSANSANADMEFSNCHPGSGADACAAGSGGV